MSDEAKKVNLDYEFHPREWQRYCLENLKRFTVCAMHRRAGKTILAINLLLLKALSKPNANYCYVCPELKQAKRIAWKPLKLACEQFKKVVRQNGKDIPVVEIRESELIVRLANGAEIQLYGADNPDNIRGSQFDGAVLDEVAQMPPDLWDEIVYPALMDHKGFALFIGTPKGINLFSELYERGQGNDPRYKDNWKSFKFTCYETDALPPEEIELYKLSVPEEKFKREMLCDFSASGSDQLLSLEEVREASSRTIDEKLLANVPIVCGVDVARFGDDNSVLTIRKGVLVLGIYKIHGLDLVTLSGWVIKYVEKFNVEYLFVDETGVGAGLVDILIARLNGMVQTFGVNFGHKSLNMRYANKRTEMWFAMAEWIRKCGIIPQDDELATDLAMPTYDVKDGGKIILESKKQIRDRLKRSPDIADSLALTFAENINYNEDQSLRLQQKLNDMRKIYGQQANDPFSRFERDVQNDFF